MEIRQLSTPQSATVFQRDGGRLFGIELPAQGLGYDTAKNEGHRYQVEFLFTPGASDSGEPVKGTAPVRNFSGLEQAIAELDRDASRYMRDDPAVYTIHPLEGFENSNVKLFYRDSRPWIQLTLLGVALEETAWTPGLFQPLHEVALAFEAERDAFESKMKDRVDQAGKSDN